MPASLGTLAETGRSRCFRLRQPDLRAAPTFRSSNSFSLIGRYRYDAWANIHYGYVGMGHGIPPDVLRTAAVIAGGVNTLSDRWNVDLGINLWYQHPYSLTVAQLRAGVLNSMRIYRSDPEPTEIEARLHG
ncbi:MAG: hypothetical protein EPO09_21125 [Aquabacterium sp.]|uniref:polymorphic toxin type 44 domain-containing protein n=1 Tax=Aquabacterium sp. TaxID=1872578 RepID=UPI0011FE4F83|nr:MAG: hypothetical protein EPO09_21125 [Aquabacterium sp.]TAL12015.1 MAG: hypothetical protein EPO00_02510 [Chloroflexota bacterium]